MIVEALVWVAVSMVELLLLVMPKGSFGMEWSVMRTMGEWFGSAAAPIDLPFLLTVLVFWITAEGTILTVKGSVFLYKRLRGG